MKNLIQQIGLLTAANRRWHSCANDHCSLGTLLLSISLIPALFVYDRYDSLLPKGGEPMS